MPVATYPHACAAAIRIFVEKSTMIFLANQAIAHPDPSNNLDWSNPSIKLRLKIKSALTELDQQKSKKELKDAWDVANGVTGIVHDLTFLNNYIHNHDALPAPSELIITWDRYHPYLEAIFSKLLEDTTV